MNCSELKTAEYLTSPLFTTTEKRLLFRLRSRTLEVKANFPGQNQDRICRTCEKADETQSHLLQCEAIVAKLGIVQSQESDLNENFIFGSTEQQTKIVKMYSDILEAREILLPPTPSD